MVSAFTLAARFFLADSAFACSSVRSGSAAKSASLFAMPAVIIPSARSRSSLIVSLFIFVFLSFSCVPQRGSGVLAACRKRNFRLEQAARRRFPFGLHKSLADSERRAAFWAFDDRVGRDVRHLVRGVLGVADGGADRLERLAFGFRERVHFRFPFSFRWSSSSSA